MKEQYIIGVPKEDYVIIYDEYMLVTSALTKEEAKSAKERLNEMLALKQAKIYKLVEMKTDIDPRDEIKINPEWMWYYDTCGWKPEHLKDLCFKLIPAIILGLLIGDGWRLFI